MASENETVAEAIEITKAIFFKDIGDVNERCQWCRRKLNEQLDHIEAAHKREVAAKDGERKGILKADESLAADNTRLRGEVAELRECLKEAITEYCTSRPHEYDDGFGNCENFKNGSCAGSECWRLECVNKWRKALEATKGAEDESK